MSIQLQYPHIHKIGEFTFTVATDPTATNILTADVFAKYRSLSLSGPSAALVGTITLEGLRSVDDDETADASWVTIQSPPGTDVAIAQDKSIVLSTLPFAALRLASSATETNDRTFTLWGQVAPD